MYSLIDRLIHWRGSALVPAGTAGRASELVDLARDRDDRVKYYRPPQRQPRLRATYQVPNLSISED
jgi:hypothetical protein